MGRAGKIIGSKYWWLWLLVSLFAVNYLASIVHARFDLTKEKRYTLSRSTKKLVDSLDEPVEIEVFLKGEFPSKFRKLTDRVDEFLQTLKESNRGKIRYRFISPKEEVPGGNGITYGDSLTHLGASPVNLKAQIKAGESSSLAFPFALLHYKGNQQLITLFTPPPFFTAASESPEAVINSAEALMEYQFARGIDQVSKPQVPGIAYAIGNGEPVDQRTYDLSQTLQNGYEFHTLDLKTAPIIPQAVNILMIVKPTETFTDDEILKIDQFLMHGGKLLCFIDNLIAEQDSLAFKPETIAYDRNLNLTELFFRYGLRINTDLVMDLQCDLLPFVVGGDQKNPQMEFLRWNYYPFLNPGTDILGKNIGYVVARFANSIDSIAAPGIKKTPLLITSPNSRTISTPALISLNENKNVPADQKFNKNAIPVAMLLEGKFNSFYRNRATQAQRDSLNAHDMSFSNESPETKLIIAADGDIVLNDFIMNPETQQMEPMPMGFNKYTYGEYMKQSEAGKLFVPVANREFLINSVEYLLSNPAIAETRNKDIVLRLLDPQKVKKQQTTWQFINIALPVLLVLLFGWIYQYIRKRKYAA